ncbi:hypothetical protein F3Y22_tig00016637pilonHSYRG00003 [Hibiscus syriacus]|uniref:Uncharacterized protein n=1 Tax=Hibiscus syriacus TaxID=106335 RepID=A0A6A3C1S3_HIBSY|nr:hypothetical protein F3Y22_tig00016637pilonHSYRG00003 [Hibiscus syriacus]
MINRVSFGKLSNTELPDDADERIGMITYTVWYMAIAALIDGQAEVVTHSGPTKLVLNFTGVANILYAFGGHAVTVSTNVHRESR